MIGEAFFNTAAVVAIGEMGDKTQVLALLLAARYRKPWPVAAGVLLATLIAMSATAWLGAFASNLLPPQVLRWVLVVMFFAVAVWCLIPEKEEQDNQAVPPMSTAKLVLTSGVTFMLAEMGDKSQAATFLLAAKYHAVWPVMAGSTLGLMLSIAPAVMLGKTTANWLPLKWVRISAAAVFAALGLWLLAVGIGN
jgi:putative Ca2+/H+ antiporter (TMEM165/GDT1 family)